MNRVASRVTKASVIPALAATVALTGCGSSTTSGAPATTSTAVTTTTSTAATTSTATNTSTTAATTAAQCPTSNTRAFAKTRFVGDIGLAAGSFHRYIYKPYQAGKFKQGADGRRTALVKAGVAAAADAKLLNNAYENVQANPTLCKALITPLGQLKDAMGGLKGQLTSGNLGAIASVEGMVNNLEGKAKDNGAAITEK